MLLLVLQFLLLTATSAGWAYWLHRLLKTGQEATFAHTCLLFLSGFAVQILLLQNLVYLSLPIRYGFLVPAAMGVYGCWKLLAMWKVAPSRLIREWKLGAGVMVIVYLLQASSGILEGPRNYYGKGRIDEINYTFVSEFLLTQPFYLPASSIHLQPWLVRPIQQKNDRIGQSVAHAYAAALTLSSAKEAYAGISSFLLALLALAAFALGRTLALNRFLASSAALWIGIAPAMARYHLEGFLSQVAALFALPTLLLWARNSRKNPGLNVAIPGILLAYVFCCYVEYYPIAIGVFGMASIYLWFRWSIRQVGPMVAAVMLSVVLVPAYTFSGFRFLFSQLAIASSRPISLENQAPLSGSLRGWVEGLLQIPQFLPPAAIFRLQLLFGLVLLVLCAAGVFRSSLRNRRLLLFAVAAPWTFLAVLLSNPEFAKYPFAKVQDSFVYLWVLLALLGLQRTLLLIPSRPTQQIVAATTIGLFLAGAATGFYRQHLEVWRHDGDLQLLNQAAAIKAMEFAESHPGSKFLIKSPNSVAAAWLIYHARNSDGYLSPPKIADLQLDRNAFEFTKISDSMAGITLLSPTGIRDESTTGGVSTIDVFNPQEEERDATSVWYWLGDNMQIEVTRWDRDPKPIQYNLRFTAHAGPSHTAPVRRMRLTSTRTGIAQDISFSGSQDLSTPVVVVPGRNNFLLEMIDPTEITVPNPTDTRKLMARLLNFKLTDPRVLDAIDDKLRLALATANLAPPKLAFSNPQGEDKDGTGSWFWINKGMSIEMQRLDSDPRDLLYVLSFRAAAGFANPDLNRIIRLTHMETKTQTVLKLTERASLSATFRLKPGVNHVQLDLVGDLPHVTKVPTDPRVHMLRVEDFALKFLRPAEEVKK